MTGQNDGQDERLTGQVHDQAGHCLLTGRYFEPWTSLTESKIYNNRLSEAKIKKLHIWSNAKKLHLSKQKELFPKAVNISWSVFRSVDKSAFWLQDIDTSTALIVSMKWT